VNDGSFGTHHIPSPTFEVVSINASEERRRRLHDRRITTHETDGAALVRNDNESTSAQPDSSVGIVTRLPDVVVRLPAEASNCPRVDRQPGTGALPITCSLFPGIELEADHSHSNAET